MSAKHDEEVAKLFGAEEAAPGETIPPQEPTGVGSGSPPTELSHPELRENTLDESILTTFLRDVKRIGLNLYVVLAPCLISHDKSKSLKNWDLWGPLVFTLLMGVIIASKSTEATGTIFSITFALMGVGAVVLTLNIILIGGTIVFFQSLCLLGYCLFPLLLAATIISIFELNVRHPQVLNREPFLFLLQVLRWLLTIIALAWSIYASFPFITEASPPERRALALYPVVLLYLCISWMIIVM